MNLAFPELSGALPNGLDPDANKIFVGGLSPETTKTSMQMHFSQFGQVTVCTVLVDRTTGVSRGFGFVTFADPLSVQHALSKTNAVDGKVVDCKKATKQLQPGELAKNDKNALRIFVGGLPPTCTNEKMQQHFSQFGMVEAASVVLDQVSQRPRGFGYVTFSDTNSVEKALEMYNDNKIDGKWVDVKRCVYQAPKMPTFPGSGPFNAGAAGGYSAGVGGALCVGGFPGAGAGPAGYGYGSAAGAAPYYGGGMDPYAGYGAYGGVAGYAQVNPQSNYNPYGIQQPYLGAQQNPQAFGGQSQDQSAYGGYQQSPQGSDLQGYQGYPQDQQDSYGYGGSGGYQPSLVAVRSSGPLPLERGAGVLCVASTFVLACFGMRKLRSLRRSLQGLQGPLIHP